MLDGARLQAACGAGSGGQYTPGGTNSGGGDGGGAAAEELRRLDSELLAARSRLVHVEHVSRSRCGLWYERPFTIHYEVKMGRGVNI